MIELSPGELAMVRRILAAHVPGYEVRAFGSRVGGPVKSYSDLDLALYGAHPIDFDALRRLREAFEESELNFRVDVVDAQGLSPGFRSAVDRRSELIQAGTPAPPTTNPGRSRH